MLTCYFHHYLECFPLTGGTFVSWSNAFRVLVSASTPLPTLKIAVSVLFAWALLLRSSHDCHKNATSHCDFQEVLISMTSLYHTHTLVYSLFCTYLLERYISVNATWIWMCRSYSLSFGSLNELIKFEQIILWNWKKFIFNEEAAWYCRRGPLLLWRYWNLKN